MNLKNILSCLVITLTITSNFFAQETVKIDSLKTIIKQQSKQLDIIVYKKLFLEYERINLDSSLVYATKYYNKSIETTDRHIKADAIHSIGVAHMNKTNYPIAIQKFKKSLALGLKTNDSIIISRSYNGLGNAYSNTGKFKRSLENYFKALPIFEKLKDTFWIPGSYLNIAVGFRKIKEPYKSIEYNNKALAIYESQNDSIRMALTYNNISGILNDVGEYENSLKNSNKAKQFFEKVGFKRYTAYPLTNIAISYDSLNQYKLAEENYVKAIVIQELNNERYELAFLNNALANLYYKKGNYSKAIEIGEKAILYASNSQSIEFEATSAETLAKSYEKYKDFKQSQKYYKRLALLNDSIYKSEKAKAVIDIQEKYETVKKEKEIATQKEEILQQKLEIKTKNQYTILLASSILILGLLSFGYYKRNKEKRKQLQNKLALKDALSQIKTQNKLQKQRTRISRDLHDNIGSQLTFIISSIDNLKFLTKASNTKLKNKLTNISRFTSNTISELRDTIWAMDKNEISIEDLQSRILGFIEKAKIAKEGISINLEIDTTSNILFTSIKGINIFRVIQETINNALKYADATKIEVTIMEEQENLIIAIRDNGKGFDINTVELGNGLKNIQERIEEIGGKLHIESIINKGTTITISCNKNTVNSV